MTLFFSACFFQKAGCPIFKNSGCRLTGRLSLGRTYSYPWSPFIFRNVPKTRTGFLEKWGKCPIPQSTVFRDASGIKSSNGYEANRKCRDFNFLHYFNKRSLPIPIMWTYQMQESTIEEKVLENIYLNVRSMISSDGHREDVAIDDVIMDADMVYSSRMWNLF